MDVKLPKVGDSADSGTVATLLVKVGDVITADQTILELEQEKAVAPIRSPSAGTVSALHVKEGDKVSVGALLITLDSGAPTTETSAATAPSAGARVSGGASGKTPVRKEAPAEDADDGGDEGESSAEDLSAADDGPVPAASPYVRKVARELGLRLSRVTGSGSGGRVLMPDLARYVARLEKGVARAGRHADEPRGLVFAPVSQDFSLFGPVISQPLTALRKVIASRMVENAVSLPHVTQFDEADMTQVEALRAKHRAAYEAAGVRLTPTAFILKALVAVLRQHPQFNASLNEVTETLVIKQYYHLGIAVDTEAGLLVPVLRDADKKSLREIAADLASIAAKARDRKLGPDDMKGGSFTVSNQGAIGGGHFTPIINKPEVAILGLGRTSPKPVVTAEGRIEPRPMLPLAVSYDHRVIDGGAAARFTVELVRTLQTFPEDWVQL